MTDHCLLLAAVTWFGGYLIGSAITKMGCMKYHNDMLQIWTSKLARIKARIK